MKSLQKRLRAFNVSVANIFRVAMRKLVNGLYDLGIFAQRALIYTCLVGLVIGAISATTIVVYERMNPRVETVMQPIQILRVIDESRISPSDVRLLAATMWGEGRDQGIEGMRAIGHVIVNRQATGVYGAMLNDVIFYHYQFSAWNTNDINEAMLSNLDAHPPEGRDLEMWMIAQTLAREILEGQSLDPTRGAIFYHTTAIHPRWADASKITTTIGDHVFYNGAL